ncbi:hypothetical protein [Bacillus sp. JCM 19041]|uniref:hypothetical protein n=1 Tax=Bacillus sp. JCM 19041 TaxID=1460637 RepID=UPI003369DE7B
MYSLSNGEEIARFPAGVRLIFNPSNHAVSLVGMAVRSITGTLSYLGKAYSFQINGNEVLRVQNGQLKQEKKIDVVYPTYR